MGDDPAIGHRAATDHHAVIDLNVDVGEVDDPTELEAALFAVATSVNIATAVHAGTPAVIDAAIGLAAEHGAAVGAHPSYRDPAGFGRRPLDLPPEALADELAYQLGGFVAVAARRGAAVTHVKPHGALYHRMVADDTCGRVVAGAAAAIGAGLVAPAGSAILRAPWLATRAVGEAFPDRAYGADGGLVDRSEAGAVLTDADTVARRAVSMATRGGVLAVDGAWVALDPDTLCLHGDTPGAASIGRRVRAALEEAGVRVASPWGPPSP